MVMDFRAPYSTMLADPFVMNYSIHLSHMQNIPLMRLYPEIHNHNNLKLPAITRNKLRKNSKKKSSYASNKIEGNPLTEKQVSDVIDKDEHKHFLKPEQEVRNY